MIEGFNLGQMFHYTHMDYGNDGFIPKDIVAKMKSQVPENYRDTCRMSGTMSNTWALDLPGFQHLKHDIQIDKRKMPQPKKSYGYAFVDFYKTWGFKDLVWTLNTHQPFIALNEGRLDDYRLWEKRLFIFLDFVLANGINISHICLDNEWMLDARVCGISSGAPNIADKYIHAGAGGVFKSNTSFEVPIKTHMRKFTSYLISLLPEIKKRCPNVKILMSMDNPTAHLRGRWMYDVVKEMRPHINGVDPHIYLDTKNKAETFKAVDDLLNIIKKDKLDIYITEWNYQYDKGEHYLGYHADMIERFKFHGVKMAMRHCLYAGENSPFNMR